MRGRNLKSWWLDGKDGVRKKADSIFLADFLRENFNN